MSKKFFIRYFTLPLITAAVFADWLLGIEWAGNLALFASWVLAVLWFVMLFVPPEVMFKEQLRTGLVYRILFAIFILSIVSAGWMVLASVITFIWICTLMKRFSYEEKLKQEGAET